MVENKGNYIPTNKMDSIVDKKPVTVSTDSKIDNIISVGGSLKIDNISGTEYNYLVDKYKPQRKDGTLRFDFDQDGQVLTVTNLKNDKTTNTKL